MKMNIRILIFVLILGGLFFIDYINSHTTTKIYRASYNILYPINEDETDTVNGIREKYDISISDKTLKELYEEHSNYETRLERLSLYSFKIIFSAKDIENYKCKTQSLINDSDKVSSIDMLNSYLETQLSYDKELDETGIGIDYVTYLDFDFKNYIIDIFVAQ